MQRAPAASQADFDRSAQVSALPSWAVVSKSCWLRRIREHVQAVLTGHDQEVCGLKWSPNGQQLASGGNDNLLNVWAQGSATGQAPSHSLSAHTAAVKALAWCPFQSSLLASGGGTADRTIRFWNTHTGCQLNCIDTESQVLPPAAPALPAAPAAGPPGWAWPAGKALPATAACGDCRIMAGWLRMGFLKQQTLGRRGRTEVAAGGQELTRSEHACRCAPCSGTPTSARSSARTGSARTSCACGSTPPWPRLASSLGTLPAFFTWPGCAANVIGGQARVAGCGHSLVVSRSRHILLPRGTC